MEVMAVMEVSGEQEGTEVEVALEVPLEERLVMVGKVGKVELVQLVVMVGMVETQDSSFPLSITVLILLDLIWSHPWFLLSKVEDRVEMG